MACEQAFYKQLREAGFRLTPQREMVLSVLHALEGSATADEIYERVKAISSAVDVSTVYRTLAFLRGFGLVAFIDPGDGQNRYHLRGLHGEHSHAVCQSCGAILGIASDDVQGLLTQLQRVYGFGVQLEQLTIPGLCADCQQAAGTG